MVSKDTAKYNLCAIYSLVFPFLLFAVLFLNGTVGVSCSDGCRRPFGDVSDIIRCVSMAMVVLLGVIHIPLYQKYILQDGHRPLLSILICNCFLCFYAFIGMINALAAVIFLGIPMMVVLPVQFFLWWYLLLSEIFHKKGKTGILVALGIIVVIVVVRMLSALF